jgi:hypothetical protein
MSLDVRAFWRSMLLSPWPHRAWMAATVAHYSAIWLWPLAYATDLPGDGLFLLPRWLAGDPRGPFGLIKIVIAPVLPQLPLIWLAVCLWPFGRPAGVARGVGLIARYRLFVARVLGADWAQPFAMVVLLNAGLAVPAFFWAILAIVVGEEEVIGPDRLGEGPAAETFAVLTPFYILVLTPWTLAIWFMLARRFLEAWRRGRSRG